MKIESTLARRRSAEARQRAFGGLSRAGVAAVAGWLGLAGSVPLAQAQERPATMPATAPAADAFADEGPVYPVGKFVLEYAKPAGKEDPALRSKLPPVEQLGQVEVILSRAPDGTLVRPRKGLPTVRFKLADAGASGVENYHLAALTDGVVAAIVQRFHDMGLFGIYAAMPATDIDPVSRSDERKKGESDMHVTLWVGVVKEMRTIAAGDDVKGNERINLDRHKKILAGSPVQPGTANDLLRRDAIDEYVFRLNRNPARRVDVAMAASREDMGVALDYLISETKPWSVYAQLSNTGTRQTSAWRERVGILDSNLTGHDDILSLDFITAGFDDSNAALGSYEAGIFGRLRGRAYVSWNEFTASDLGQNAANQEFSGEETVLGGELIANIFQHKQVFVDAVAGVRYRDVLNHNSGSGVKGDAEFWEPYFGLRLERTTEQTALHAALTAIFGTTSHQFTSGQSNSESLTGLGRQNADSSWQVLQGEVSESFYLEPLFLKQPRTIASEIVLSARGQWAFDNRLVPQEQEVLGGLYTIRGYPESLVAGDNMIMVSAEYRLHIPRAILRRGKDGRLVDPSTTPVFGKPFRWTPSEPVGPTDWDLVFKGFIDAGRVTQNDITPEVVERNDTLVGAGVGFELSFKQNMTLRMDYGIALRDAGSEENRQTAGDGRLHVVFTILY